VIAADKGAASGRRLDDNLGAVDMAGDDISALIDQRIGGFRFLHRQRPFTREDDLACDRGIDRARAQEEGIDVEQHLRDGLGCDKADLLALRGMAGRDAVQILPHADVAEVGAGIHRVLVLVPHAAAMAELHIRELGAHRQHMRVEIAKRGREDERGAIEIDHALHGLLHIDRLGDVLLLDDGHAFDGLEGRSTLGMGLVVAIVILGADVDEADGGGCRQCRPHEQAGGQEARRNTRSGGLQKLAAGKQGIHHLAGLLCVRRTN
jgi:hypothetical protein